jgi:5-methylcytosine-specific restriction endonuclease McrBC regulatory subunit McrC
MIGHFNALSINLFVLKNMVYGYAYMNAKWSILFPTKILKSKYMALLYTHWLRILMFQFYSTTLAAMKPSKIINKFLFHF